MRLLLSRIPIHDIHLLILPLCMPLLFLLSPAARRRQGVSCLLIAVTYYHRLSAEVPISNFSRRAASTPHEYASAHTLPGRSCRAALLSPCSYVLPAAPCGDDRCRGQLLSPLLLPAPAGRSRRVYDALPLSSPSSHCSAWRRDSRRLSVCAGYFSYASFVSSASPVSGKPSPYNPSSCSPVMSKCSRYSRSSMFLSSVRGAIRIAIVSLR